jgi:murein DD-endopeptidase MepM/ murein hydrolase activator NlpD
MEIRDFLYGTAARRLSGVVAAALLLFDVSGCGGSRHRATPSATPEAPPPVAAPAPDEVPEPDGAERDAATVRHVVLPGETLWRIARQYGTTVEEIAAANGIDDPSRVAAGSSLVIPGAGPVAGPGPGETAGWSWPVAGGNVLSYFGSPRPTHTHAGIDIDGRSGQRVLAARSGKVVYSGSTMRGYGKTVILDHGDGLQSLYAHNSKLLVRKGDRVERGSPIALVGRSGNATGDHVHFEIRKNDVPVDPLVYLSPTVGSNR